MAGQSSEVNRSIAHASAWLGHAWKITPFRAAIGALRDGLTELFPHYCREELAAAEAAGWQIDSPDAYCARCGATCDRAARTAEGCPFCLGQPVAWHRLVRLSAYREPMDRWIRAMKFRRSWMWGRCFGSQLAQAIEASNSSDRVMVCAVPMHLWRRWRRGYNQAQLIAEALAHARGWPLAPLLHRTRHTRPQTHVPPSRRHDNISGSFAALRVDLRGWEIWLVDDVKTSGATLTACTRLLLKAGAARVNIAVASVADPKSADFKNI